MNRAESMAAMVGLLALTAGCSGSGEADARSPTVTAESTEFKAARAKADSIEKANREAERKALRGRVME